MKKFLKRWAVLVVLLASIGGATATQAQGTVSFQVFYDQLQPYGTWMNYGNYGYVWIPQVDRDFMPYGTNGYWVNTEYGNTWVSDYAWGWAPFHYGRWLYDDFYGWMWVPGNEWAPAWVAWRNGGGYYGWAPLMPGMGISVSVGIYDRIPNHCWNFVPYQYVTYRRVYAHCVPRPTVVNIIHQTTIVTYNHRDNHHTYFTGPSRHEMERDGRTRVDHYRVDSRNAPGRSEVGRGTVAIYRPQVQENTHRSAAPTRVVQENEMRRRQETTLSQRDRSDFREQQREPASRPAAQPEQRRSTDANGYRDRQQDDNERQQQQRMQQQDRIREQQVQDHRQQENNRREQQQHQQMERAQQERVQEQQRQQQDRMRDQQQQQDRRQQQERMQAQQRGQQQEQQRQQQDRMREQQQQQNLRQQQQQQQQMREVQQHQQRQQVEQRQMQDQQRRSAPAQVQRERTPGGQPTEGGRGSQRRRQH